VDFLKKKVEEKNLRQKRNQEVLEKMKSGESLMKYDSSASWFPPRPIIKKDRKAIEVLHGVSQKKSDAHQDANLKGTNLSLASNENNDLSSEDSVDPS
jgi:hypothetical protein